MARGGENAPETGPSIFLENLGRSCDAHRGPFKNWLDSLPQTLRKYPTFYEMVNKILFSGRKSEDDTVVEMLASAIRRDISFGVLHPDQKLKLADLRQSYGGSNHSMRETLRILSSEGLAVQLIGAARDAEQKLIDAGVSFKNRVGVVVDYKTAMEPDVHAHTLPNEGYVSIETTMVREKEGWVLTTYR